MIDASFAEPPRPGINLSPPQSISGSNPPKNGSSKLLVIVIAVIVIVLVGAGAYFVMSKKSSTTTASTPVQTQSADSAELENLKQDLNSVNVDDSTSDFATVDEDIKGL